MLTLMICFVLVSKSPFVTIIEPEARRLGLWKNDLAWKELQQKRVFRISPTSGNFEIVCWCFECIGHSISDFYCPRDRLEHYSIFKISRYDLLKNSGRSWDGITRWSTKRRAFLASRANENSLFCYVWLVGWVACCWLLVLVGWEFKISSTLDRRKGRQTDWLQIIIFFGIHMIHKFPCWEIFRFSGAHTSQVHSLLYEQVVVAVGKR